ncbi:MAG: aminotransferase class IV [Candidatus Altiarchaeota archaeon]|nr:aminotransferase class IV [Candidatus Altiarchaeota archaeon]
MKACVNGRMVGEKAPAISVLDYGILYGYGLFESMLAINGTIFRPDKHLLRLRKAGGVIRLPIPWADNELKQMLQKTLNVNKLKDAYIRLTITKGPGEPRLDSTIKNPTLVIIARNLPKGIVEKKSKGVKLAISNLYRINSKDIRSRVKTTNYLLNALAKAEADALGANDVILLNEKGMIAECSTANIFTVSRGMLITPSVESGILPGVTRDAVIEIASKIGIKTIEKNLAASELTSAQEAFKTSSITGITPITQIDGKKIGNAKPGGITRKLQKEYDRLIKKECGMQHELT